MRFTVTLAGLGWTLIFAGTRLTNSTLRELSTESALAVIVLTPAVSAEIVALAWPFASVVTVAVIAPRVAKNETVRPTCGTPPIE